jgi:hypothetical protein
MQLHSLAEFYPALPERGDAIAFADQNVKLIVHAAIHPA